MQFLFGGDSNPAEDSNKNNFFLCSCQPAGNNTI